MQHATEWKLVTSPTFKHLLTYCTTNCWHCAKLVQFVQPFNAHCQQQCDSSVIKRAQNMYMGQTFQPSVCANSQEASPSILPWVYPCGNPPILDLGHGASTIPYCQAILGQHWSNIGYIGINWPTFAILHQYWRNVCNVGQQHEYWNLNQCWFPHIVPLLEYKYIYFTVIPRMSVLGGLRVCQTGLVAWSHQDPLGAPDS